jgi:GTP cyclohydrolase I/GTP cyclohydrolase-4
VREAVRGVIESFPGLAGAAFVEARQVNLETIHQHNVVAERFGTLEELRRELQTGIPSPSHTTRRSWLDAAGTAV